MQQHTPRGTESPTPLRPVRILIEDPIVAMHGPDVSIALDVTSCGGPRDEHETCPLVMDGSCPLGPFDIVVSALDGPWARCVHAAWRETGTPVIDATDLTTSDPDERLAKHLGAALQRLWPSG